MPSAAETAPRFVVAQTGARRGYAVPAILQRAGMLERLYTDVSGNAGWGRWLALGKSLPGVGPKLRRLANRRIPAEILDATHSFPGPNIRWFWRSLWAAPDPTERFRLDVRRNLELGTAAAALGFGNATHLYVMLSEFTPLMQAAQAQGLKVVSEIYILISTHRLLADERRRFPGWDPEPPDWDSVLREFHYERAPVGYADFYLCPSEAVANDLARDWNIPRYATAVVPYGMNPEWLDLQPKPQPGRILFAGTADLRKGIHYLAMASEELLKRGRKYEFRVAGHVEDLVRNQPSCRHLNFLGRVPRDRIQEEYQRADLFALPTLAEGSAEVTYEALAAGVPLVTTPAAGSVARDGLEGIIVPERDPLALANALEGVIENRELRNRMAAAARERAREYTWDRYGERLISTLLTFN